MGKKHELPAAFLGINRAMIRFTYFPPPNPQYPDHSFHKQSPTPVRENDLDRKMWLDDWIAHSRRKRKKKRPHGDDTRERSTAAPPEAQLPQADVSSRTHHNNVIAPGSES